MSASYTVVLTKGTHTVRAGDAEAICHAIEAGEKLVRVGVELFPGSDEVHPTTLVIAHVIALAAVEAPHDAARSAPNVAPLWKYR